MVFMGNVDAGKTQLLDKIRNTAITAKEAGGITQAIGASIIPLATIKKICGKLLSPSLNLSIPGILTIDTPGHAAFSNMRKRGGNLADIAVVVIDITDGVKPQTIECLEILRHYKTPFVIALNKIDLISGWKHNTSGLQLLEFISRQEPRAIAELERKLYEIVGSLAQANFFAERFDRVDDYTKMLAMIPTSGLQGDGIPELLMVIAGLSQKFLQKELLYDPACGAKGTVIEVKIDKGMGKTVDAIIYDGVLHTSDTVVIGGISKPIITKVKALFEPAPLSEMRDKKTAFACVKEVHAATGVKICAPELDEVYAGMPLRACMPEQAPRVAEQLLQEIEQVVFDTDAQGIVVKADSLGSLEAVVGLLQKHGVVVKRALIGEISKKDLLAAQSNFYTNPLCCCILGFNVGLAQDVTPPDKIKIFTGNIIYKLLEDFQLWQDEQRKKQQAQEIDVLVRPCKIQIMRGYVFRQSNPAIVGVEVHGGTLSVGMPLMKADGVKITEIKGLQLNKENVQTLEKKMQAAASLPQLTVGRNINEGDFLYSAIPESHFRKLKELKKLLSSDEIEVLKEIIEIMRKGNSVWGV